MAAIIRRDGPGVGERIAEFVSFAARARRIADGRRTPFLLTRTTMLARRSLLLLSSLLLTLPAAAQAVSFDYGGIPLDIASTNGWRFTPDEDIDVTAVGLWDDGADGFAASHDLAIWSGDGATMLLSTQIPAGTAAPLAGPTQWVGRFRYLDVAPTRLLAGTTYVIGAFVGGDPSEFAGLPPVTSAPGITFHGYASTYAASLLFPGSLGTPGGFGPNFLFRPATEEPALEIDVSPAPQILNFDATRGWRFRAEQDVVVRAVGMWDHDSDGLATSHDLRIWSGDGSAVLLDTQIPAGTAAPLSGPQQGPGRFRYHDVAPLVLQGGQEYVIGMQVLGDDFLNDGVNAITSSDAITWLEDRFTSGGFSFPTYTVGTNTYFGPNFLFETPVNVVGSGCIESYASYYEQLSPAAMDLSGMEVVLNDYGGGFHVSSRPGTIQPIGSVGTAVLGPTLDDSAVVMGAYNMEIHSNCQVAFSAGNSTYYVPSIDTMLNVNPATALYAWTDLNPVAPGSGQIWFEENGADYQVTYDGVFQYGTTDPVTVQFRGNRLYNSHVISFGSVHATGRDWLIGYSPGGANLDPGPIDYSSLTAAAPYVSREPETLPLQLEAVTGPQLGGPVQVRTSNFEPGAVLHLGLIGLSDPNVPLSFLGLDSSCVLHCSPDVLLGPAVIVGQPSFTWEPIDLTTVTAQGVEFYLQGVTMDLTVLSGATRLSNGLKMRTY